MDSKQATIASLVVWGALFIFALAVPALLPFMLIADLAALVLLFIRRKEIKLASLWLAAAVLAPLMHFEIASTADAIKNPDRYFESEQEVADRWLVLEHTNLALNHGPKTLNCFRTVAGSPSRRPKGKLVMALGSSSTYGEGVKAGKTWPAFLKKYFQDKKLDVDVRNAGVSGYNLFQLAIYSRDVLAAYKPDLMILYYGANEGITESAKSWRRQMAKRLDAASLPSAELREKAIMYNTTSPLSIMLLDALHESYAVRRIIRHMQYFSHSNTPRVDGANPQPPYKPEPPYLDEILDGFIKDLEDKNISVMLVPEMANTGKFASEPVAEKMKEAALKSENAQFIDLRPAFAEKNPKEYFLENDFIHPNEKGHELLATDLASYVESALAPIDKLPENKSPEEKSPEESKSEPEMKGKG